MQAGQDGGKPGIIPARAGFTADGSAGAALAGDHPRSRGVYDPFHANRMWVVGSSPLARGLQGDQGGQRGRRGIIPARAGFTRPCGAPSSGRRDHPRSRGVYAPAAGPRPRRPGSSPLARGLPSAFPRLRVYLGIIPARAGFTGASWAYNVDREGSSPLARGLRGDDQKMTCEIRIIPARAGFTAVIAGVCAIAGGSSPLARGLLRAGPGGMSSVRIIPARAGFTGRTTPGVTRTMDHPRSRGVYARNRPTSPPSPGSSPLARGLREHRPDQVWRRRIIPARAGFTPRGPPLVRDAPDHPRSRGVYSPGWETYCRPIGSSPLARGLRHALHSLRIIGGIIPARAGFTIGKCGAPMRVRDHPRSRGVYTTLAAQ